MRIFIRSSVGWPHAAVTSVRERFEFALGRFASRVRSITVRLGDLNGPRGGIDKTCAVTVQLERPRRVLVVEDVDADPSIVVGRVAARTARSVSRVIDAASDFRRVRGAL
jgi:hypothetical protein